MGGFKRKITVDTVEIPDANFWYGNYYRETPKEILFVARSASGKIYRQQFDTPRFQIEFGGVAAGHFTFLDEINLNTIHYIGSIKKRREVFSVPIAGTNQVLNLDHWYRQDTGSVPTVSVDNAGLLIYAYTMTDEDTITVPSYGTIYDTLYVDYFPKWRVVVIEKKSDDTDQVKGTTGWGIIFEEAF